MKLGGQGDVRCRGRFDGQGGYAMATLLVGMAIMAIFMTVALPAWSQMAQREKESEYLFRASQYALAIKRYQQKMKVGGNAPAPSVTVLIEQKFLRKKFLDPITGKDFVYVLQNAPQAVGAGVNTGAAGQTQNTQGQLGQQGPGQQGQQPQAQQQSSLATAAKSLAVDTLKVSASTGSGGDQPFTGVTSSSKESALRLFKGQETTYDQWAVTVQDADLHLGGTGVGTRFAVNQAAGQQQQQQQQQGGPQGQSPFQQQGQSPFGSSGSGFGSGGTGTSGTGGFGSGGSGGFGTPGGQGVSQFPPSPFGGSQGTTPAPPVTPSTPSPFGGPKKPLL